MDSMQNQDKIQDTQKKLAPLEQEYSEIQDDGQIKEDKGGKQSNSPSAHQLKNGEEYEKSKHTLQGLDDEESMETDNRIKSREIGDEVGPRERLKRHRREVAGQVWIPEMWGQEELLMDWIDCSAFDACLVPQGIMSARESLMEEARRSQAPKPAFKKPCRVQRWSLIYPYQLQWIKIGVARRYKG